MSKIPDLATTKTDDMRSLIRSLAPVTLLTLSSALVAQTTFCLTFVEISNTSTELTLSIQASANNNWFLGSSNLVFEVDPTKLSGGTLLSTPLSAVTGGPPFFDAGYIFSLTNPTPSTYSFNIVHKESFFTIAPTGTEIAQVQFSKLGPDPGDVDWLYNGGTTLTVAFELAPGGEQQIFATTPGCLNSFQSVPLPVELLSFSANKANKNAHLTWATASETNNYGFWLEHSLDGRSFEAMAWVDGEGKAATYSYLHEAPIPGRHYYRLKQVDRDGSEKASEIRTLAFSGTTDAFALRVWPNPTGGELRVNVDQATSATLFDNVGREVWSGQLRPATPLDLSGYAPGLYALRTADGQVAKIQVTR